ncbi:hypothetical protein [Marilutibacter spongiae]|uniref:Uncharacterized protein n=1 Tax=Marilutibacter spongiae TaxID=2025720 RepID=A0A7W3TMV5_9GAMM|nr:hypothetical protein [Lysobacter spongiae]MBB1061255.1 hypothetical protein [Lysobacter spongiae]
MLIKVLGCGVSEATELDREHVDALVLRNKMMYPRQSNNVPHAANCPLSSSPLNCSRRPNAWREVRLREIARRLRPART